VVHESTAKSLKPEEWLTPANEILEAYEEEYTGFLEWAYQVLTEAVLEQAEIESALRQYAGVQK